MKNLAFVIPFLGMLLTSCENDIKEDATIEKNNSVSQRTSSDSIFNTQDLLWNSLVLGNETRGVTKRNFVHLNCTETSCNGQQPINYLSDLSALITGKPSHIYPYNYLTDTDNDGIGDNFIQAIDSSAASLRLISLGYDNKFFRRYPGYDIYVLGGYDTNPITFTIKNNTRDMLNPTNLREVGLLFEHWPGPMKNGNDIILDALGNPVFNGGWWGFKQNYKMGNFNEIEATFKAKLNHFYTNLSSITNSVYCTADLRFAYFNSSGTKIREDLLGVIFYTGNNYDLNGNITDPIYWQDFVTSVNDVNSHRIMVRASKLTSFGIGTIGSANQFENNFSNIRIPYKAIATQFLTPPTGYSINDAIITGFDVYSSTRGYNVEFDLKNVRLVGIGN